MAEEGARLQPPRPCAPTPSNGESMWGYTGSHARGGCVMPGVDVSCQGWMCHARGGCIMPGVDVSCQGWMRHARGGCVMPENISPSS